MSGESESDESYASAEESELSDAAEEHCGLTSSSSDASSVSSLGVGSIYDFCEALTGVSVFPTDPASLSQGKDHFQAKRGGSPSHFGGCLASPPAHTRCRTSCEQHSTAVRQSYTVSACVVVSEGSERQSGRRAALALPA